jgi:hypothetical protein
MVSAGIVQKRIFAAGIRSILTFRNALSPSASRAAIAFAVRA